MKVTQIYEILNTVVGETLGKTDIVAEDLSNIVDIGKEIIGADALDKYVKSLINRIGKVVFVDRVYKGQAPSVMMDGWEYGSILEKINMELPDTVENASWSLENGQFVNQDIFHAPKVDVKFFNDKTTFEIDMSFAEKQVKQSFANVTQMNAFFSMIEVRIQARLTIDYENLIMRTINNFTCATVYDEYGGDDNLSTDSKARAINLLHLYKAKNPNTTVTAENCLYDLDFIKFASYMIMLYSDRMERASQMFNIGGKTRYTPKDQQHIVLLSEFAKSADVYLQSDTFHNELVKLPKAETVTFWQGSGLNYDFSNTSEIHANIKDWKNGSPTGVEMVVTGVLGVIFDRTALGVTNIDRRITTHYNAKGEFINNFYKSDANYFNDYNENFVVFFVA